MRTEPEPTGVTDGAPLVQRHDTGRFLVTVAEFDGTHRMPSHYHARACLSLILKGRFVQRFPGAEYECPPGGLLVKPPEERHDDRWCGVRTRHVIVEPHRGQTDELGPLERVMEGVAFRIDPTALGIGRRVAAEIRSPDDVTDLALEGMALELIVRLHRGRAAEAHRKPPAWLERVRECLTDRHGDSLRLFELAAEAGVHPTRLSRQFRECYGVAPADYLRRVRLQRAMDDLEAGRGSLAEVAHRRGFADQSHLTRWLKRTTGITPAVYRAVASARSERKRVQDREGDPTAGRPPSRSDLRRP